MAPQQSNSVRPVTWMGVAFGFSFLMLSLFLPHQYLSAVYRYLFPYLKTVGLISGAAGFLIFGWAADVGMPRWTGAAGKWLLAGAFTGSVLAVTVPFDLWTHTVLFGTLVVALLITIFQPDREPQIFLGLYEVQLVFTGALLIVRPELLLPGIGHGPATIIGLLAWLAAMVQALGQARSLHVRWMPALGILLAVLPFGILTALLASAGNWRSGSLHLIFTGAALVWGIYLLYPWQLPMGRYQRRLLALAVSISIMPTVILGAVAIDGLQRVHREEAFGHLLMVGSQAENALAELVHDGQKATAESVRDHMNLPDNSVQILLVPVAEAPPEWQRGDRLGTTIYERPDGERHLTAYLREDSLGLVLTVMQPVQESYRHVLLPSVSILMGTLLLITLTVLFSLRVTLPLGHRLWQMQQALTEVGARHFEIRLPQGKTGDEISALAGSINEMAATLETYHAEIQSQSRQLERQNEALKQHAEVLFQQNRTLDVQRRELKARAEQQSAIAALAHFALSGVSIQELTDEASQLVTELLKAEFSAVAELLPDGSALRLKSGTGWPGGAVGKAMVPNESRTMPGYALSRQHAVITPDQAVEGRYTCPPLLREQGIRSSVNVVIAGDRQPYGVLGVFSTHPRAFSDEDAAFLESVAGVLATAVERGRYERRAALQYAVTRELIEKGSDQRGAVGMLEAFCRWLEWDAGFLLVPDGAGKLHCDAVYTGDTRRYEALSIAMCQSTGPLPDGPAYQAFTGQKAVWVREISPDGLPWEQAALAAGLTGTVFFPLWTDGEGIAVLQFFSQGPAAPDQDLEHFMHTMSLQIGSFVARRQMEAERADLLRRESAARARAETAADQIRRLQAVTDVALTHLSLDELMPELLARTCDVLGVDAGSILLINKAGTHLEVQASQGYETPASIWPVVPLGAGLTGWVAASGTPWLVDDVSTLQLYPTQTDSRNRSMAAVPLRVDGRVIGVLSLSSFRKRHFTAEDEQLMILVSDRLAMAIDHARLVAGEVEARRALEIKAAEVQELNAELERRVALRTAELEAAVRELESFSYSISHDLRAPLRTIDGFSQALLEDYEERLNGMGKDYLHRVRAAAQEMGRRVDAMLILSRLTRAEMENRPVDLSEVARTIADELQERDPARSAQFEIQDGLTAMGDERMLRIALENLLENSWKFTAYRPEARIAFGREERDGGTAFFVRDNGVGFDMTFAAKLFRPFQRLHSASEFPGTGIGLATIERIVRRHGGRIWAEAVPDQGATFYFRL